jgi:serine/threonine protein kinase
MNILLVDDEPTIIQSLLPALKAMPSVQVRVATTGSKALEHVETFGRLDVLITDVVMSPMDGFTLRDQVLERCPAAKTIFMSGYELEQYASQLEGCPVLQKPFGPDELREAIQEVTQPRSPHSPGSHSSAHSPSGEFPNETETSQSFAPDFTTPGTFSGHDPLIGTSLGGFQILAKLGEGNLGPVYQAVQETINRPVALKMLSAPIQANEEARIDFLQDVSAKANVEHPGFVAIYEAGKDEGVGAPCYYAREYIEGFTLSDLVRRREFLRDEDVANILRAVAVALNYLHQHQIKHRMLHSSSIFLTPEALPRVANLATQDGALPKPQWEISALAGIVFEALDKGRAQSAALQTLLEKMATPGAHGIGSWSELLHELHGLERKMKADSPTRLSADSVAAIRAADRAKRQKTRNLVLAVVGLCGVLPVGTYQVYSSLHARAAKIDLNAQCKVPAGAFAYGNGEQVNLGTFWIDKFEVTIGQYAEFVQWIKEHPEEVGKFEHESQPRGKSHIPPHWESLFASAKWGAKNGKVEVMALSFPQFSVDYWDAYAYAAWKGRRLPTEQEWEKAARGTDRRAYPWGNRWDPARSNTGASKRACASVNAFPADVSPYGVVGMAGSLNEWTDSWDPETGNPVVRGSSFASSEQELSTRTVNLPAETRQESLGFRTCSSTQ